jgi:type I restriction enzyme R subunit
VRKLIIDESPINPKYYETMSSLLDALIAKRKEDAISYQEYLTEVVELTKQAKNPTSANSYPSSINSNARKALYDNLGQDANLAVAVDSAVLDSRQDDWRGNAMKIKRVRLAIKTALDQRGKVAAEALGSYSVDQDNERLEAVLELVKHQHEY